MALKFRAYQEAGCAYAGRLPVPRLYLIDTFGFIFRAYHARARSGAPPMRTATGLSTEAIFIFHNMLRKLMTTYKPDYIAAIFESSEPTFPLGSNSPNTKPTAREMPPDLRRTDSLHSPAAGSHAHSDSGISGLTKRTM